MIFLHNIYYNYISNSMIYCLKIKYYRYLIYILTYLKKISAQTTYNKILKQTFIVNRQTEKIKSDKIYL